MTPRQLKIIALIKELEKQIGHLPNRVELEEFYGLPLKKSFLFGLNLGYTDFMCCGKLEYLVLELFESGLNRNEIAEKLNIRYGRVQNIMSRFPNEIEDKLRNQLKDAQDIKFDNGDDRIPTYIAICGDTYAKVNGIRTNLINCRGYITGIGTKIRVNVFLGTELIEDVMAMVKDVDLANRRI